MQLKAPLFALALSFFSGTMAAVANQQLIPIGKTSCAVSDTTGRTLVFYQAADDSIVVRSGTGLATNAYTATTIVVGNTAKSGTPLACVLMDPAQISSVRLYYFGTIANGVANGFHELIAVNGDIGRYGPGPTDGVGATIEGSQYLYALRNTNGFVRIGFQCGDGRTCEYFAVNNVTAYPHNVLNW